MALQDMTVELKLTLECDDILNNLVRVVENQAEEGATRYDRGRSWGKLSWTLNHRSENMTDYMKRKTEKSVIRLQITQSLHR